MTIRTGCMMRLLIVGLFCICPTLSMADEGMVQPRRLIDAHTAGVLPRAHFDIETRIYPSHHQSVDGAGITFSISVGITDRLMFGGGYGADGLVGRGKIKGNPLPGLLLKYRLIEESYHFPGIAIGYDWQGYGGIDVDDYHGYVYKSQGFFVALSKNYLLFQKLNLGLHGAANYSLEEYQDVKWPNAYVGVDFGVNEELAFALEYDLALNQQDPSSVPTVHKYCNPFRGILNAGLRWAIIDNLYVEFDVKDVLENKLFNADRSLTDKLGFSRELKLVYVSSF